MSIFLIFFSFRHHITNKLCTFMRHTYWNMVKERIIQLREQLNYHNRKYYVDNAPEISDFEFDRMMRELQDLEAAHPEYADPNSPTARVGSDITTEFATVHHRFPMLSLSNTYSIEELREFVGRVEKEIGQTEFVCEQIGRAHV